ncbi:MAG: hypothetical protein H6634_00030 [Anaerolineales bacterium]|nr:hypothetical protein [Anaerolineales bacterium]
MDEDDKILQIIPAIPGIFGKYIDSEDDSNSFFHSPVVCFALVETTRSDGTKYQFIQPMDMSIDGIVESSNTSEYILPSP